MQRAWTTVLGMAALTAAFPALGSGQQTEVSLKVGDKAPAFACLDDTGKPWKSTEHVGKGPLVVYFFPAAMTGG